MKFLRGVQEEGFTLLEVMIVAIIVGILSAVSVPVFKKQIKTSVHITIVADVRNAVSEMEKEETFSKNGYEDKVPDSFISSDGNNVSIVPDQSSDKFYCLVGTNDTYKDLFVYYHSTTRKLITNGTIDDSNCGDNDSTDGKPKAPVDSTEPIAGAEPTDPSEQTGAETGTNTPGTENPDGTTETGTTDPSTENPDGTTETGTTDPSEQTGAETGTTDPSTENPDGTTETGTKDPSEQTGAETGTTDPSTENPDGTTETGTTTPSETTNPGTDGTDPDNTNTGTDPTIHYVYNNNEYYTPGTGTVDETYKTTIAQMPEPFKDPYKGKYEFCRGNSMNSSPISAILNTHRPDDIIPPIPGVFKGQNWTIQNSEDWYNNCSKERKKYDVCHNGNMLSLPVPGILNGHIGHRDDIVPPIPGHLDKGWNWDTKGIATWKANCAGQRDYWKS